MYLCSIYSMVKQEKSVCPVEVWCRLDEYLLKMTVLLVVVVQRTGGVHTRGQHPVHLTLQLWLSMPTGCPTLLFVSCLSDRTTYSSRVWQRGEGLAPGWTSHSAAYTPIYLYNAKSRVGEGMGNKIPDGHTQDPHRVYHCMCTCNGSLVTHPTQEGEAQSLLQEY